MTTPACPKCGGQMWDNRQSKKNPKQPDYRCRDIKCVDDKGYVTALWEKDLPKQDAPKQNGSPQTSNDEPPIAVVFSRCLQYAGRVIPAIAKESGVNATMADVQAAAATLLIAHQKDPSRRLFKPEADV